MSKIVIPGLSEEFGGINKSEWTPILVEDETILLMHTQDKYKKIWVLTEEWKGKTAEPEKKKEVSNSISLEQTEPIKGGVSDAPVLEYEGDKVTLESLEQLRLDELFLYAMLEHGEQKIRDKIYCLYGYCKSKCASCGDE